MLSIRPLTEDDIIKIIERCGGSIAHPDSDSRTKKGADFLLSDAVIELKMLDEDGFQKSERQRKLANIFTDDGFDAPVVVLDQEALTEKGQRAYNNAIEGPIKNAVSSANKQLKQTRSELPEKNLSILWILNNGYTALNDDELAEIVERRVRNDTSKIDGVIVGGSYFHSDSFESFHLWPLRYIQINPIGFPSFLDLDNAWKGFATSFMTDVVQGTLDLQVSKGPVIDTQFELGGVTFIKPAPPIGGSSDFFPQGRPRKNSTGIETCPPVALTFPSISKEEWDEFKLAMPKVMDFKNSYKEWRVFEQIALETQEPQKPTILIPILFKNWEHWVKHEGLRQNMSSVYKYTASVFELEIQKKLSHAREFKEGGINPSKYILAITDEIGQDKANDLSHIAVIHNGIGNELKLVPVVRDQRIFHEHAVALAAAYALSHDIEDVLWSKNQRYAWV